MTTNGDMHPIAPPGRPRRAERGLRFCIGSLSRAGGYPAAPTQHRLWIGRLTQRPPACRRSRPCEQDSPNRMAGPQK